MTDNNETKSSGGKSSAQGGGSDTMSAAKISAGTSVGNVGGSPMPKEARQGGSGADNSRGSKGSSNENAGAGGVSEMARNAASTVTETAQSAAETVRQGAQSAMDTAQQAAESVQQQAGETLEQATDWARRQYEQGTRQFSQVRSRSMQQMGQTRGTVQRFISENPVMVGVAGLAAGLLLGALLPRSRQEDRYLGRWADEVRDQGLRYAREATQRGRELVEETFTGTDPRFANHDSEWRPEDGGQGGGRSGPRYQS
jgi:ElaB/YqjD/DUF883 family membrane-anchored ribosome-binding protein